ncbi:MAG TPA: hypothetical protein VG735_08465 [Caulobacterales bacterium]|nr:hypothetical protein [Caulobacterales bacterium]
MKALFILAAAVLTLSCGAALAEGAGGGGGRLLAAADANKDGAITKTEFDAMRAKRFDEMDKNKDGVLTGDELMGGRRGGRGLFAANGEGKISRAEFLARAPLFDRLDTNKDGVIDAAELAAIPARRGLRGAGG